MTLAIWLVLAACAVAVATDVSMRRIPNLVNAALVLAAVGLAAVHGPLAVVGTLVTFAAVLVLGFVAFSFGWLGGGDVKLLAAGAAVLGFPDAIPFLVYTAVGGGVLALAFALATGRLVPVLRTVAQLLRPFVFKGTVAVAPASTMTLPYACAIAFGAVAVALSHTAAPFLRLPL